MKVVENVNAEHEFEYIASTAIIKLPKGYYLIKSEKSKGFIWHTNPDYLEGTSTITIYLWNNQNETSENLAKLFAYTQLSYCNISKEEYLSYN